LSDAQERIEALLAEVYGGSGTKVLGARIAALIEDFRARHPQRESPAPWSAGDAVLISYGDSLQSPGELPLRTLHRFLRERVGDAISTLHILPFFPFSSDDGFAVTDFRSVREALGDWPDIDALAADYPLAFDLVLNHCSREHLWFTDYVNDRPPGRDFFIEADPSDNLGQVVRPRSSPLLSGVRTPRGMRHVWTTFSNDQVDLDYSNPDVLLEFVDILLDYVGHGARILRLDAVAFLWKEIGTSCIHLPQTHAIVKLLRAVVDEAAPGTLILTETNVPNAENLSYFGGGDEAPWSISSACRRCCCTPCGPVARGICANG
jgi:sucrose phosphorylase